MSATVNKRRQRYCHLGSMSEVHAELTRLRRLKRANRHHLEEDWEDVKCALSPSNLLHEAMGRLACSSPAMGNVMAGVQAVIGLLHNRRRSRQEHCGCE